MKFLILVTCLLSYQVQAETGIQGQFGDESSLGESSPTARSRTEAQEIFKSLNLKANELDRKVYSLADGSFFDCRGSTVEEDEEFTGASCSFFLRLSQKPTIKTKGKKSEVSFTGDLAQLIMNDLNVKPVQTVGATVKKMANLSCTKAPGPFRPRCVLSDVTASERSL